MPDEKDQQNKSEQPKNPNPSRNEQQRRYRKSKLDATNLMGAFFWITSAFLTSIVLMVTFLPIPATCLGDRGQLTGCTWQIISSNEGITIIVLGILLQAAFSTILFRLRHDVIIHRTGSWIERAINAVGIYWLLCVQLGAGRGVYETVTTFTRTLSQGGTFLWWIGIIAASIGWDLITDAMFKAPGTTSGGTSQQQPRR